MYKKVMVANRGLIQASCVRAIQELGAKAVVACESSDFNQVGVRAADEVVEIRSTEKFTPYLDVGVIVEAAVKCGADAVHPGYGFLAQSIELEKRLREKGIAFIAPVLEGEKSLANKDRLRRAAQKSGFATLPASSVTADMAALEKEAPAIGYPLLVKAAGAYGGRAIRMVRDAGELKASIDHVLIQCERFGYEKALYLEKFVTNTHVIEYPVLRDKGGRVLVLPEQECSVQRRFRKLLIETPSTTVSREVRGRLEGAIPTLVNTLEIVGFASVEFLVNGNEAYLLDVKGTIQPFHGATALLTGVDVLREQIRLHSGDPLKLQPAHVRQGGHVIAANIAAMDPYEKFSASPGRIERFYAPYGEGVVVQSPVVAGDSITAQYDSVLAKVMVVETSREEALTRMSVALEDFQIEGVHTTIPLLRGVVQNPEFLKGTWTANYLFSEERRAEILSVIHKDDEEEIASMVAAIALNTDSNASQIMAAAQEKHGFLWSMASRLLNRKKMEF